LFLKIKLPHIGDEQAGENGARGPKHGFPPARWDSKTSQYHNNRATSLKRHDEMSIMIFFFSPSTQLNSCSCFTFPFSESPSGIIVIRLTPRSQISEEIPATSVQRPRDNGDDGGLVT
jgi:hypothetical protein